MNAEWITAIGTIGTFVVIAASAVAALLQLRHMRSGNQISAYNECRETMESVEFREALNSIRGGLSERLRDPQVVAEIVKNGLSGEYSNIRLVANLFESMGLFVKAGMMEQSIACELWSGIVLSVWECLSPITARVRRDISPGVWVNFEYMAVLSLKYLERFPDGGYPHGVQRMALPEVP